MKNKVDLSAAPRRGLGGDFLGSAVVFLVALPLCMGVAIASGLPPAAGLLTGIVGGILVGALSGSPLQVSGPAAGLTVLVYDLLREHGPTALGVIIAVAGLIQLAAGLLRLGQWFRAVSPAVIRGMLSGIGVLIFVSQFHVMVDDVPRSSGLQNLLSLPEAIWKGFVPWAGFMPGTDSGHAWAARVGALTIILIVAWTWLAPRRLRLIPGPLIAVSAATILATFVHPPIHRVDAPANLLDAVRVPSEGLITILANPLTWFEGLALALVASAETLLCASAVDRMHRGPRTRYDRELAAQGVGNMVCGAIGGLPMTGVIVRSAANVNAGASTRLSAILHGVWLLLFVAALPWLLREIPTAALAAVLVYTGYKLIDLKALRELGRYGRSEVAIFVVTVITIVGVDLLTGVLTGVGLSALKLLYTFSHLEIRSNRAGDRIEMRLRGAATFIRLPKLAQALEELPPKTELHVNLEELDYIDHACLDLLMNWERQHEDTGGALIIDWEGLGARFRNSQPSHRNGAARGDAQPVSATSVSVEQQPVQV